jgi:dihydropyrimidinase
VVERLLVRGGTVWTESGPEGLDVLVEGGRVLALPSRGEVTDAEIVDADGLEVLPGLFDFHVHVADRIGPYELADDFVSASRAAVLAGVTTLGAFATQRAGETIAETAARYAAKVGNAALCDVHYHLTPTGEAWDWQAIAELLGLGWRTLKLYTTYRQAGLYTSWERLEEVMQRLAGLGGRLLLHCEDDAILQAQDPAQVDLASARSHTALRPESAEVSAVAHAADLAASTGCALHVVHVSTADAAELIEAARSRAELTCETGPQYLLLDDSRLAGERGHRSLCSPPLRAAATRCRLERLAVAGAFDLFATDHCPFARADKDRWDRDFRTVPNGVAGLGAMPGLLHELLCARHGLPLGELALRLSTGPARAAGLYPRKGTLRPGSDADLVVVDPRGPRRPLRSSLADTYETYEGLTSSWTVQEVLLGGQRVVSNGAVVEPAAGVGRCLPDTP